MTGLDENGERDVSPLRRRLGAALIALGLVGIAWGALYIADAADGERAPTTFAQRVSYNQAKERIHRSFAGGFTRGLTGLLLCIVGSRLRR
jgi:hypothetical protein